ncbi:MAG: hypothetical protein KTR25_07395 [Myxococcales bacterium]|nr:hypothetical protein [Myxococcales bacterium]
MGTFRSTPTELLQTLRFDQRSYQLRLEGSSLVSKRITTTRQVRIFIESLPPEDLWQGIGRMLINMSLLPTNDDGRKCTNETRELERSAALEKREMGYE